MYAHQGSIQERGRRRRAAAALWALFALTTMLVALAVAVNAAWLGNLTQEMRSTADSAALAAAEELMSDEWLRTGQPGIAALLEQSRERAAEYAALNRVLGRPLLLDISNPASGDVVFGQTVGGVPSGFLAADLSNPSALVLNEVNTTAVTAKRLRSRNTGVPVLLGGLMARPSMDMAVSSLAYLDRDVYGFRARPGRPIPVVPLGVRSDPSGMDTGSWEYQIIARNGPDAYAYDPLSGVVNTPDLIPEIVLQLQLNPMGTATDSTVAILTLGSGNVATQITGGITEDELAATSGVLALDATHTLDVPGTRLGPADGSGEYNAIRDALLSLIGTGEARIWPLVSDVNDLGGTATINAFVVARVMEVVEPSLPTDPLQIRLQPSLLVVPYAMTDFARSGVSHLLPSPYLARPRVIR